MKRFPIVFFVGALGTLPLVLVGCASVEAWDSARGSETGDDGPESAGAPKRRLMDTVIGDEEDEEEDTESSAPNARPNTTAQPDRLVMVLPGSVERITIDRFLRERRTFMVRFLPLEPKFAPLHDAFAHKNIVDDETTEALRQEILQNPQLGHWLFLHGSLVVQDVLADPERPLLLEQQKGAIAHFGRTLTFLARTLDDYQGEGRYQDFVRRLYVTLSRRYLYRDLRKRQ